MGLVDSSPSVLGGRLPERLGHGRWLAHSLRELCRFLASESGQREKAYFFVEPEAFPATTTCRVASVDAEDAALTLRSARSITCWAAFLAAS